ncbi:unnamed protein product [Candidula unifasciata]|uniref:Signal peptidase complex subunit 1 n=1 Tax=Candidula unifasciata TaxID=100452 RepID=A0A8S3ZMK7_9EUPU|nr:unnamed protein product [Candidula unifasciata]
MEHILPLLPDSIKSLPHHMDFDGQGKAERYFQAIIIVFAVIGFVYGYAVQLFSQTLYILFVGVFLSSLLTLIPWGFYRRKPLKWQPARDEEGNETPNSKSGGKQPVKKKLKH